MRKIAISIILFFIFFVGSYIRLAGIATNSFAFTYDVGRDMLALQQIVYHHKIPLIGFTTGIEGIFYGPWWYYILTLPFAISAGNPQFVAYFIGLTGIGTFVLLFFLGKKIRGITLGITLSFLCAISPVMVGLSGQIWNPNIAPILIVTSLFIVFHLLKRQKWWHYLLLGIISGLLVDTEVVFGLLLIVAYIIALCVLAKRVIFRKESSLYVVGVFIIFFPRIFFELRHQFLMTKTVINLLTHPSSPNGGSEPIFAKLTIFFNQFSDTLTNGSYFLGFVLLLVLVVSGVLLWKKIASREKIFFYFSCIVIGIFVVGIFFFKHDIWPHYLVGIPVFYILVSGIILNSIYASRKVILQGLYICILIALFWINVQPISLVENLNKPLFTGDASVYRNQLAVVDYIYEKAHGQPFNYVAYSPAVFAYPYQYLFSWYGPKKYHYAPSQQKERLFFLIIEPDFQHPSLLLDWLKLREHDGKIISQQVVKGGVLVQMRVH